MQTTYVVVGLGFGDEGKGSTVDALVRRTGADLVVRFNGGSQAAHNVVTPGGRHHTFSQWGSGTFVGSRTLLSHYVVVDPLAMLPEAKHLDSMGVKDPWRLMIVDPRCLVITPYHRELNRLRSSIDGHGTCGVGFGEVVRTTVTGGPVVRWEDLGHHKTLKQKLSAVEDYVSEEMKALGKRLEPFHKGNIIDQMNTAWVRVAPIFSEECLEPREGRVVVFEGAQGILLDQDYGFHPHTTWSTCTSHNARTLIAQAGLEKPKVIGVVRAQYTRHGAGPFPSEMKTETVTHADEHNASHKIQGAFRTGLFDAVLARYALTVDSYISHLALTCVDRMPKRIDVVEEYYRDGLIMEHLPIPNNINGQDDLTRMLKTWTALLTSIPRDDFVSWVFDTLDRPLAVISRGNTYEHKQWLFL